MTNISGINEEGIDKLIYDIYNCYENIHKELENIYDYIDKTEFVFKNDIADKMRFKIDSNKIRIQNVFYKIEKYIDILLNVKMKYQDINIEITNKLKNDDIIKEE